MADAVGRLLASALGALEQQAAERAARDAADEARYGRRTDPNRFERYEDGVVISSLVVEGPHGIVVYEVVGVSFGALA